MKLLGLSVENLYGSYNYEVSFNHDVTFIYGMNGCGKTTILNITEAIITGQLFKLFSYSFKRIELRYSKKNSGEIQSISITPIKNQLNVTFGEMQYYLDQIDWQERRRVPERERIEAIKRYFHKYPFLEQIANIFNYVYLPLNRTHTTFILDENPYYQYRRLSDSDAYDNAYTGSASVQDSSIFEVEALISRHCSRINAAVNRINDAFRNEILQSALSVQADIKTEEFARSFSQNRSIIDELLDTKHAYLSILDGLRLNSVEKEKYEVFFEDTISEYRKFTAEKVKEIDIFNLYRKHCEVARIKNIVKIAKEMEERKARVRKPIELFLDTMNSFISNSEDGKEIKLDPMGQVYFMTKHSKQKLSVHNLSSGEKQLLIFFANLIFNVKSDSSGIFVVDEPELSLHLDWQRIFVEKTMEVNQNIQLIFATHAPEIIGRHRNKMYKLVKEYTK